MAILIPNRVLDDIDFNFRVVTPDTSKEINGHLFTGWGAHAKSYRCAYLTAAAAIGMAKEDVDTFLKRLDKCLSKFTSKESNLGGNVAVVGENTNGCENDQKETKDSEVTEITTANR